ncbi:MAG: hypothetical protein AB1486_26625 [Planctomycetota bacterium]
MIRRRGDHAIWVERGDGDVRIVAALWTALQPRVAWRSASRRPLRLTSWGLAELARWVAWTTEREARQARREPT